MTIIIKFRDKCFVVTVNCAILLYIYTFEDIKFIEVKRDDVFIQGMFEKLTSFYNNYFRQELLDKFYYRTDKYVFE